MMELVTEKHQYAAQATLLLTDSLLLVYMWSSVSTALLTMIFFITGAVAIVLYIIFVPESPKWLFITEGTNSTKGIKMLNYIAWMNGVK